MQRKARHEIKKIKPIWNRELVVSAIGMLTTLDRLDLSLLEDGLWTHVDIGVGAHNDKFSDTTYVSLCASTDGVCA